MPIVGLLFRVSQVLLRTSQRMLIIVFVPAALLDLKERFIDAIVIVGGVSH